MPGPVGLAVIAIALMWGWVRVAAAIALIWAGLPRPGELIAADGCGLLLPSDSDHVFHVSFHCKLNPQVDFYMIGRSGGFQLYILSTSFYCSSSNIIQRPNSSTRSPQATSDMAGIPWGGSCCLLDCSQYAILRHAASLPDTNLSRFTHDWHVVELFRGCGLWQVIRFVRDFEHSCGSMACLRQSGQAQQSGSWQVQNLETCFNEGGAGQTGGEWWTFTFRRWLRC